MRSMLSVGAMILLSTLAASGQEAPQEVESCPVATPTSDVPWRLVRADGFTFCVPQDWAPVGKPGKDGVAQQTWRSGAASITWRRGRYQPERVPFRVQASPSSGTQPPQQPDMRRMREAIGGFAAELWIADLRSRFTTGAEWEEPTALHLVGEARRRADAELQLEIYRTVRVQPKEREE